MENQNKYKMIDLEDDLSDGEPQSFKDIMEEIKSFNESLGTDYSSIEEFNRGEEFYQIVPA